MTMHNHRDRSHDAGERLRCRRETEAQGAKLVHRIPHAKPQVTARSWMYRNLEIGILEVQGYHPVPWAERLENGLGSLHVRMGELHPTVEAREIDDWSPTPADLGGNKEATVKPGEGGTISIASFSTKADTASDKASLGWNLGCSWEGGAEHKRKGAANGKGPDTRSAGPVLPKHRLPTTPKPPNAPRDTPLPCKTRDMAPISENLWRVSKQKESESRT